MLKTWRLGDKQSNERKFVTYILSNDATLQVVFDELRLLELVEPKSLILRREKNKGRL